MDPIERAEHLFQQVELDISGLLQIVHDLHKHPNTLRTSRPDAIEKMEKILASTGQIGGRLLDEAKILRTQLYTFLEKPSDEMCVKIMRSALQIKQETREI